MSNTPNFLGEEASVAQDLRNASPAAPRRLVALTLDAALSRSLEELTVTGVDVCVVSDTEALCDELLQGNSAIALIDAAGVQVPLPGLVDALATQFPDLRLLVAGQSGEQNQLATRISQGRVFRFVHKPASAQRLKLFLDAASRPVDPQRVSVTQTVPILSDVQVAAAEPPRPLSATPGGRSSPPLLTIGIVAVALFGIAFVTWLFWPQDKPAPAAAASAPQTAPATDLVRQADQAFAAARYVGNDGLSAAELYRKALTQNAGDSNASNGYERSIEFGLRDAEAALLAGRVDEAAAAADTLRKLEPGNSRLAFLQSQIDRERSRVNQDANQRAAYEARQAQVRSSISDMNERVRRGALLEPASNNAMLHYRAAEDAGPGELAVRNARDNLLAALLNSADTHLESRDVNGARRMIDAAASLNDGAPGLAPLRRRLTALEAQMAQAAAASAAAVAASAPAPSAPSVSDAAPAPVRVESTVTQTVVPESQLRRLRAVQAAYPKAALSQLLAGWVEMEFTVAKDGSVTDVTVTASEPADVFDASAVAAMRRWRYAPVIRDGAPVEQRAKLRMRFTANDQQKTR